MSEETSSEYSLLILSPVSMFSLDCTCYFRALHETLLKSELTCYQLYTYLPERCQLQFKTFAPIFIPFSCVVLFLLSQKYSTLSSYIKYSYAWHKESHNLSGRAISHSLNYRIKCLFSFGAQDIWWVNQKKLINTLTSLIFLPQKMTPQFKRDDCMGGMRELPISSVWWTTDIQCFFYNYVNKSSYATSLPLACYLCMNIRKTFCTNLEWRGGCCRVSTCSRHKRHHGAMTSQTWLWSISRFSLKIKPHKKLQCWGFW